MRSKIALLAALAIAAMPLTSLASTSTLQSNVNVNGSVEENCTIATTQSLGFPAYDANINATLDLASNQSGNVKVQCSVGSNYKLTPASGAQFMTGPLPGGTDHLNYTFAITGGGVQTGATLGGENWPITGVVLHGQNVHHGPYSDLAGITITVALQATP